MARDGRPVIETVGLTKVFKDFWHRDKVVAVHNLDLEIRRGEVFGLLGPNGSGKSTTIKIILGLLYPTRGRVSVFSRPPTDVAIKERIGYLPEESYLYPFLNARETLDYYGRLFQQPRHERTRRTEKLLEMAGLVHQARRRVGEYSKGMARRIGLAQALINDPDLLILDEPTTGLDPIGTRQIKDLIRDLARRGKTILLSSHLLADVEDVCDRVAVLYGGERRALGEVKELLGRGELTQIITERISAQTIERIRELIDRLERKAVVGVSTPTEKLEELFLRIVQEAQAAEVQTSGVRAGGALPEFLTERATEGTGVIESLVAAAEEPEPSEPIVSAPASTEAEAAASGVIDELVEAGAAPADEEQSAAAEGTAAEPQRKSGEAARQVKESDVEGRRDVPQADRAVIDSLTNTDTSEESE